MAEPLARRSSTNRTCTMPKYMSHVSLDLEVRVDQNIEETRAGGVPKIYIQKVRLSDVVCYELRYMQYTSFGTKTSIS